DDAVVDPHVLRDRQTLAVEGDRRRRGIRGIREDAYLLAEDLLADAVPAPLLRKEAASLVGLTRIRGKEQVHEKVRNRSRLEDDRILGGLDRGGILRERRLLDRRGCQLGGIELTQLVVRPRRPSRSGSVRRSCRQVVVGRGEAIEGEEALRVGDGPDRGLR